eukprot:9353300-Pyramimonas_sp.AAC.1
MLVECWPASFLPEILCPAAVRPLSPEAPSQLLPQRCDAPRWSGHFRLRHLRSLATLTREMLSPAVVRPLSPETSSQL